jgi:CRP-like cAMP-binding protein
MYIIKDGSVSVTYEEVELRRFSKGDFFGELALLYDSPRLATVTALGVVKCVSLGRDALAQLLGHELAHVIYRNISRMSIEAAVHLERLTSGQIDNLLTVM